MKRGEIYIADLDPTRGAEQTGRRRVLFFQHNLINRFTRTVICIPFTATCDERSSPRAC